MMGKAKPANTVDMTRTKVCTIIGHGAVFHGDMTAPETIRVDGLLEGDCSCDENLILGAEGQIKGNIHAQNIIISETVEGDVTASGKMEILSTGRLTGNITARSLVIDEDAYFDGRCTMTTSPQQETPKLPVNNEEKDKDKDTSKNKKK